MITRSVDSQLELNKLYDLTTQNSGLRKTASSNMIKLTESKDRFTRVAFDLFRDSQSEFIWKLEKDSETGEEYIIRTASKDPLYKSSQGWTAHVSGSKDSITLVYKSHAIKSFKKAEIEFSNENIEDWRRFLVDKIGTDPNFLKNVLASVDQERLNHIVSKFPELLK